MKSNVVRPKRNALCYLKNMHRLEQLCQDNKLKLLKDYTEINVTLDTIIEAECMAEGCNEKTNKNFRTIDLRGCYCKIHIKKNKRDKLKTARNTKTSYDIELLQQLCKDNNIILLKDYTNEHVTRETMIDAKCLTKGCNENVNTTFGNVVYRGCYCDICANKNKHTRTKATCNKIYGDGVENPSQSPDIKQKKIEKSLQNFGVKHTLQSPVVRDKGIQTNLKNLGVKHPSQSKVVREKMQQTCFKNHGVYNPSQSKEVRDKAEQTCLENHGVSYAMQSPHVQEKSKQTCLLNHGVKHPLQNSKLSQKAMKTAYTSKDYTFPSGRTEKIQGYEHYMLDELLQQEGILEDDIVVSRTGVPECWYTDINGKNHRYFVDCYIKSQNRCIEVKSTWTAKKDEDEIFLKQKALKDLGYECEIWVYNSKGKIEKCYK